MQGMPTFGSEGASLHDTVPRWAVSSDSEGDTQAWVSRRSASPADEVKPLPAATRAPADERAGHA